MALDFGGSLVVLRRTLAVATVVTSVIAIGISIFLYSEAGAFSIAGRSGPVAVVRAPMIYPIGLGVFMFAMAIATCIRHRFVFLGAWFVGLLVWLWLGRMITVYRDFGTVNVVWFSINAGAVFDPEKAQPYGASDGGFGEQVRSKTVVVKDGSWVVFKYRNIERRLLIGPFLQASLLDLLCDTGYQVEERDLESCDYSDNTLPYGVESLM